MEDSERLDKLEKYEVPLADQVMVLIMDNDKYFHNGKEVPEAELNDMCYFMPKKDSEQ